VDSVFPLIVAEFLKLNLWNALSYANTRAIVSAATFGALKPHILPFAFLFRHRNMTLTNRPIILKIRSAY
jgi:hypothetical protein